MPWQGPTPGLWALQKVGQERCSKGCKLPAAALVSLMKGFTGVVAPLVPLLPTVTITCVRESPAVLVLAQQAAEGVPVLVQVHI